MNPISKKHIQRLEDRLKTAMLHSDVAELDDLLASDLIFTNHIGQIMTKQDDLNTHKSGLLTIEKLDLYDQLIKFSQNIAIVSACAHIRGNFGGKTSESTLRFTRIWQETSPDKWQIVAAHSSAVPEASAR